MTTHLNAIKKKPLHDIERMIERMARPMLDQTLRELLLPQPK